MYLENKSKDDLKTARLLFHELHRKSYIFVELWLDEKRLSLWNLRYPALIQFYSSLFIAFYRRLNIIGQNSADCYLLFARETHGTLYSTYPTFQKTEKNIQRSKMCFLDESEEKKFHLENRSKTSKLTVMVFADRSACYFFDEINVKCGEKIKFLANGKNTRLQ